MTVPRTSLPDCLICIPIFASSLPAATPAHSPARRIGLTGGIACGKSFVATLFRDCGAMIIDADTAARQAVTPGKPALEEIIYAFGSEFILPDGSLDRKRLGDHVFSDPLALDRLNEIIHPRVFAEMTVLRKDALAANPYVRIIEDIPLLFECELMDSLDLVIVVFVPPEVQLARLMKRDGRGQDDARRRIAVQIPLKEKCRQADIVIDNSGSREETRRQVRKIWTTWDGNNSVEHPIRQPK
ncbi:MAG: dephospho-CoA kinase [Desulfobacterales bacterium]|nr:MAG: dephospho-CoA kinase [Desulfobacterales bacterium]